MNLHQRRRSVLWAVCAGSLIALPGATSASAQSAPVGGSVNSVDSPELTLGPLSGSDVSSPGLFEGRIRQLVKDVGVTATTLPGGGMSMTDVAVRASIIVPTALEQVPFLIVSPSFGVRFLDAPGAIGLPSELYSASLSVSWIHKWNDHTTLTLGLTGGTYSDFEASDGAFRMSGHGMANIALDDSWDMMLGIVATNQNSIPILPVAGFVYKPNDDTRIELAAPRPRVAWRVDWLDDGMTESDDWVYVAGEFGGGSYAVRRPNGTDDEVNFRDFRIVTGIERKVTDGIDSRLEFGYVFGRQVEFENDPTEYEPGGTVMFRAGLSF